MIYLIKKASQKYAKLKSKYSSAYSLVVICSTNVINYLKWENY